VIAWYGWSLLALSGLFALVVVEGSVGRLVVGGVALAFEATDAAVHLPRAYRAMRKQRTESN